MAWSKEERRKMVEEGSSLNNSLMSRILGHRWKQLGEEEKKAWKKTADKLKKEHAKVRFLMTLEEFQFYLSDHGIHPRKDLLLALLCYNKLSNRQHVP